MAPRPSRQPGLPALLRAGLAAYRHAVQAQLVSGGFDDLPRTGPYVLGAIATQGGATGELIKQLAISKQAASKLFDTLVVRGYLERRADAGDRRRVALVLTDRGRAAALIVGAAVKSVDSELAELISPSEIVVLRKGLAALAELEHGGASASGT